MNLKICHRLGIVVFSLFALLTATVYAEGSVGFQENVISIIKTRPIFEKFILNTFQMKYRGNGWGIRISNETMPHLGGARIGPYTFDATWRGPNGTASVTLVVNTRIKFFDRIGREIKNGYLISAYSFKETLDTIEVESDGKYKYQSVVTNPLLDTAAHTKCNVSFQSDILPIIKTRPTFEKFILGTLKISDDGWGVRIGEKIIPRLGGARIGPYRFHASWHGTDGDTSATLIINTNTVFFDSAGNEIPTGSLVRANSFKEIFDSIEIDSAEKYSDPP
jgi:hypothetical protein